MADPVQALAGARAPDAAAPAGAAGRAAAPKKSKMADAAQQFEAFFVQSFIQEMLPKDAPGVYGGGVAGDIWRSMLAEKLSAEVASRGDLGIAKSIRKSRPDVAGQATEVLGSGSSPSAVASAAVAAASSAALTGKLDVE